MITGMEVFMIHDLKDQGLGISEIARRTGLDRKTVRSRLSGAPGAPSYEPRKARRRLIDDYKGYLRRAWGRIQGCRGGACTGRSASSATRAATLSGPEVSGGREVVALELGARDPVPGVLGEREEGGVHDEPDREPQQRAQARGAVQGALPGRRLGEEAAGHRGAVEGAAGLLVGGEARIRDPVRRPVQAGGGMRFPGGMAAPRRVPGAGFSGLRYAPASESGSGNAPNPMVRSGRKANSECWEKPLHSSCRKRRAIHHQGGPDT